MVNNAKEWATARNLVRINPVHKAEEFKVPTLESYSFAESTKQQTEQSGSMELDDPNGSLLDFSGMSAENTILNLGMTLNGTCVCVCQVIVNTFIVRWHTLNKTCLRQGSSSGGANQMASQSATTTKQLSLPMVQQNQDPFCYLMSQYSTFHMISLMEGDHLRLCGSIHRWNGEKIG